MRLSPNAVRYNLTLSWRADMCQIDQYTNFFVRDLQYEYWAVRFFRKSQEKMNNGLLYSHTKIRVFNNNHMRLQLYFYDGFFQDKLFRLANIRRRRFRRKYKWVKGIKIFFRRARFFRFSKRRKYFLQKKWKIMFRHKKRVSRRKFRFLSRRRRLFLRRRRFFSLFNNITRKRWGLLFHRVKSNAQKYYKIFSLHVGAGITQSRGIQSAMIARYVVGALVNRFNMLGTVYRLLRGMIMNRFTPGIMVHCSGRFDRRQRKTYKRFQKGKMGIYKFDFSVDYFSAVLRQKYGACGVKIWLAHYLRKNYKKLTEFYRGRKISKICFRKQKFLIYKKYKKNNNYINWIFEKKKISHNQNFKNLFFQKWYITLKIDILIK